MDARGVLVILRDVVTLAIGVGGVIHEEFYTTSERPVLIGLYAACLIGVATANARKLVQTLSSMVPKDDDQPERKSGSAREVGAGSTSESGTSSRS